MTSLVDAAKVEKLRIKLSALPLLIVARKDSVLRVAPPELL